MRCRIQHTTDQNLQMPHAQYRYYGGFHLGFGRDAFSELLVGKTSGLRTRRIELRGQVPVAVWGNGNRLFLGAVDNIRFSRDRNRFDASGNPIEENDVFRLYVVYEVDFLKIFGLTPPK